ncbi:hypothetical protein E4U35_000896 [Claviceps purpurea]|nr:hypothetical protein E4U35_000896 [Claviceps purpurea]KAG6322401.1 hypothetical protein E4U44_003992 [Claviceps purpurea]
MSSTNTSSNTIVKLASMKHWSRWIEVLKQTAGGQNVWYKEPEMPGNAILEQYIVDRTTQNHILTMLEAIQFYHVVHLEACTKYKSQETK